MRYLAHVKADAGARPDPADLAGEFKAIFGRDSGGLVRRYRTEDAETIVVAMGSVLGTIKDTIDEMRDAGVKIGVLGVISFRPFPLEAVREALKNAKRVVVLEKTFAVGIGGILDRPTCAWRWRHPARGYTVVAGLGGVRSSSRCARCSTRPGATNSALTFLDLDWNGGEQGARARAAEASFGADRENILRDVGNVAAHGGGARP